MVHFPSTSPNPDLPKAPQRLRPLHHLIIAMAGAGLVMGLSGTLLEKILETVHDNDSFANLLFFAEAAGFIAFAPLLPKLLRYLHPDHLIGLGLVILATSMMGLVTSHDILLLSIWRLLMGIGKAILFIIGATMVNTLAEKFNRGALIGLFAASFMGTSALAPLLMALVPFRPLYMAMGAVIVLILCLIPFFRSSLPLKGFQDPIHLSKALIIFRFPLILILAYIQSINTSTFEDAFFDYAQSAGYSASSASLLVTITLGSAILFAGIVHPVAHKVGYTRFGVLGSLIITLSYGALALFKASGIVLWPACVLLGATTFAFYILAMIILGEHLKGIVLASAMAGFMITATLCEAIFAGATGLWIDTLGEQSLPIVMGLLNALGLIGMVLVYGKKDMDLTNENLQDPKKT